MDSVPDFDMLAFLPEFLDGLLNMLSDPNREIRQQVDGDTRLNYSQYSFSDHHMSRCLFRR